MAAINANLANILSNMPTQTPTLSQFFGPNQDLLTQESVGTRLKVAELDQEQQVEALKMLLELQKMAMEERQNEAQRALWAAQAARARSGGGSAGNTGGNMTATALKQYATDTLYSLLTAANLSAKGYREQVAKNIATAGDKIRGKNSMADFREYDYNTNIPNLPKDTVAYTLDTALHDPGVQAILNMGGDNDAAINSFILNNTGMLPGEYLDNSTYYKKAVADKKGITDPVKASWLSAIGGLKYSLNPMADNSTNYPFQYK